MTTLTPSQESNLAFKKLATDKATSDISKAFFEESTNSRKAILMSDVWTQSNQIPSTAAVVPSVVSQITDLTLTLIAGTNAFTHNTLKDIIPYNHGDGVSYLYVLKTSTDVVIPFGFRDWYLDPEGGVLTFFDGFNTTGTIIIDEANPPKISCYKYIGTKGDFATGGASANVNTEVFTPTNGQTVFNLSFSVTKTLSLQINGQRQVETNDFTVAGTVLTWLDADFVLETTDELVIKYEY